MTKRIALATLVAMAGLSAPASAALSTSIVSTSIAGPNAAMTGDGVTASCGARPVSGGGARMDQAVLSNGTHLNGMWPTTDGTNASNDGDASPHAWYGAGAIGGQATSGVATWSYAVCLDAGPQSTQVVMRSTAGPDDAFTSVLATATCPAGTQLLSGGARTTPNNIGSLKPNGSFPSDEKATPVIGGVNPASWSAAGLNGDAGRNMDRTYSFALCSTSAPALNVQVVNARVDGPGPPSTAAQATANCPAGTVLLGGGGYISDHFGIPGSQGDHLTGSYPSDAGGHPVTSGPAQSWTATTHTGGTLSGDKTDTNVWAMCAAEVPAGSVPLPGGGGTPDPSNPTLGNPGKVQDALTVNQIREQFRRQMTPMGKAAAIPTMRKAGGAKLKFVALAPGRLRVSWYTVATKRRKSQLFARGEASFTKAQQARSIKIALTPAGVKLLKTLKSLEIQAKGTFTRATGAPIIGTKSFNMTNRPGSTKG